MGEKRRMVMGREESGKGNEGKRRVGTRGEEI